MLYILFLFLVLSLYIFIYFDMIYITFSRNNIDVFCDIHNQRGS